MVRINRQWRLASRPQGLFKESDFTWSEHPVRDPQDGEVVVLNQYLSLDPTNRGWASMDTYLPAVELGEVMRGIALGTVVESRDPGFREGDRVQGMLGWQEVAVVPARQLTRLPHYPGLPPTAHLGLLGHIGLTAYYGLLDIGQPRPGETLVVSAAAGAVGSLVGQIGKIHGCRVVGIAGSDEKCRWITEELDFDAAVNYKNTPVPAGLRKSCPEGIDVYFDNVGGKILDAVLARINLKARVVICGLIAQYNAAQPVPGPYNFANILVRRARVEGFIVLDYLDRARQAFDDLARWAAEGRLKYRVEVVRGLENAPRSVNRLFDGSNQGKLIIQVD